MNEDPYFMATDLDSTVNSITSFIIIGAGLIGPRHASHIHNRSDCSLFAIVDHSSKGPSVAEQFGTLLFKNLNDMLDYCELNNARYPDAAIIATPNHTHLPLGMKLASYGIHLLMEKPLASNAMDCKTLIDYCNFMGVILLVGHHRRFNPYIVAAKKHIHKLGKLVGVQGSWTLRKPDSYFMEKPWRSSCEQGGGTLLINLVHDLDLLQYLLGPIEKVYADLLVKQRTDLNKHYNDLVDEGAALTIRFANGCCGTFICSDNVTSPFLFESGTGENPTIPFNDSIAGLYRIFGSHGTLSIPDLNLYHQNNLQERSWLNPVLSDSINMNDKSTMSDDINELGMQTPLPSPKYHTNIFPQNMGTCEKPKPFDLQLDHFINLINGTETAVLCSGNDALKALLCIESVIHSIETGLPQFVEDIKSIEPNYDLLNSYKHTNI